MVRQKMQEPDENHLEVIDFAGLRRGPEGVGDVSFCLSISMYIRTHACLRRRRGIYRRVETYHSLHIGFRIMDRQERDEVEMGRQFLQ